MANANIDKTGPQFPQAVYMKRAAIPSIELLLLNRSLHPPTKPIVKIIKHHGARFKNTPPACREAKYKGSRHIHRRIDCAKAEERPKCKSSDNLDGELDPPSSRLP